MGDEKWISIIGYEDKYMISNFGNVKSLDKKVVQRNSQGFYEKVYKGKQLKLNGKNTYSNVTLSKDGELKTLRVHTLVAKHFIPNLQKKPTVNHINGDKKDNRVENLEWCTHKENLHHARYTGLNSKLSIDDVKNIRESDISNYAELGRIYNVTRQNIRDIKLNKIWVNI